MDHAGRAGAGSARRQWGRLLSFRRFVAIDWSGAVGERHAGIAIALAVQGDAAPRLVRPERRWSRAEVAAWLAAELPEDTLVGIDSAPALPFLDRGAYFPGWSRSPPDARALWALVEEICAAEPHLAANAFTDHPEAARHFRRHGGRTGDRFGTGRGRLRLTEHGQRRAGLSPYSCLNLVGAAQVGKSALTTMRLLARLDGLPVWPLDPRPSRGAVLVEIYTALAARAAGVARPRSKLRDAAALDAALERLGSRPTGWAGRLSDHQCDALLSAAWLRAVAHDPALWAPPALTPAVAATEGWTFGVVAGLVEPAGT
jgi:hypothetical protein